MCIRDSAEALRDEGEKREKESGKPTARDATGEKQEGYKDDDEDEEPPIGK